MSLTKLLAELQKQLPEDSPAQAHASKLAQAIAPYEGLDPQQAKTAIEAMKNRTAIDGQLDSIVQERDTFKTAADSYQADAIAARKELFAVRGLVAAGVRPEYEDLLLPKAAAAAEVKDGNISIAETVWPDLKQRYPAMFFAEDAQGTGTTGDSTTTETSTESYRIDEDGFLQVRK